MYILKQLGRVKGKVKTGVLDFAKKVYVAIFVIQLNKRNFNKKHLNIIERKDNQDLYNNFTMCAVSLKN